jgi:hypothetical protein
MKTTLIASLVCLSIAAAQLAASSVNVTFNKANGQTDSSGNLISPHNATVAGASTTIYCDDFANEVSNGETWTANVTNLASGNLSNTRYGGITEILSTQTGTASFDGQQLYEMTAWLTEQYGSNAAANGNVQDTIWDLFNPNAGDPSVHPPQPSSNVWLFAAEQNYGSVDAANFNILTNTSPVALSGSGQVQEFLFTPEPSSALLLGIGLMAISIIGGRLHKRLTLSPAKLSARDCKT